VRDILNTHTNVFKMNSSSYDETMTEFICPVCRKQYKIASAYTKHLVIFHNDTEDDNTYEDKETLDLGSENLGFITYEMLLDCLKDRDPVVSLIRCIHFNKQTYENLNIRYYRYRKMGLKQNGEWKMMSDIDAAILVYENAYKHLCNLLSINKLGIPFTVSKYVCLNSRINIVEICKSKTERFKDLLKFK
jgi:hypothetical protein